MRLVNVVGAFALILEPSITPATAQTVPDMAVHARTNVHARTHRSADNHSPLLADCTETSIMPEPMEPRPTLRRATFTHPLTKHRHIKRKAHARHVPHQRKPLRHRPAAHRHAAHRAAAHRPAHRRPVLHRVTYASPLCESRSEAINDMLGLPGYEVTQVPVAADTVPGDTIPALIDVPPLIGPGPSPITGGGGGPTGPGPIIVGPIGPGPVYPPGPGPIVIVPPGPPVVTPPVVSNAPEPASWATMLIGMALIGGSVRRRRTARTA